MTSWDPMREFTNDDGSDSHGSPLEMSPTPIQQTSSYPSQIKPPVSRLPTPPVSNKGSPPTPAPVDDENVLVSVSTTFYPGAVIGCDNVSPDLALLTTDSVFFYVHHDLLSRASNNRFMSILPPSLPPAKQMEHCMALQIPESSDVLNIILHSIYDMSCAPYNPAFHALAAAVERMPQYGLDPRTFTAPERPLFGLLLTQAPLFPIECYALAGQFELEDLAVACSSHLLSMNLASLSDDMARKIGPVYLKRLFFLHFGRCEALKRVLLSPPHPHPATPECDFVEQKRLTRAWALAGAYLAWEARPDLSTSSIESALIPLAEHLSCADCRSTLEQRIHSLVVQWSLVKRTI